MEMGSVVAGGSVDFENKEEEEAEGIWFFTFQCPTLFISNLISLSLSKMDFFISIGPNYGL